LIRACSYSRQELLGNLKELPDKELTKTGSLIKQLLTGSGDPESSEQYKNPPSLVSQQCKKDTCCVWSYVAADMKNAFQGKSGRCNGRARQAVRLGFHDAGTWNVSSTHGGADGSVVLAVDERGRRSNAGLGPVIDKMQAWYDSYHAMGFEITMADLIQMGASVATVVCPLGPRMRTFVGRPDSHLSSPDGLLPSPFQDAAALIKLFQEKTIGPNGLVALVGAHTTSQQGTVDPARAGDPQDSTPGVWDNLFYKQTLRTKTPQRVFKFQSDVALSQHAETRQLWKSFASHGGQQRWNEVSSFA
jgi:hypothetical protein